MVISVDALLEELVKTGYGPTGHTQLMEKSLETMGTKGRAPMASLSVKGSLAADKGVRLPHIPTNAPLHAMPGASKMRILREAAEARKGAIRDITKAIAQSESPLAGARATRGLMNLGQVQHTFAGDLAAHYEKPVDLGISGEKAKTLGGRLRGRLRTALPKIPGGSLAGPLIAGTEHSAAGGGALRSFIADMRGQERGLDLLRPEAGGADARALQRAESFGRSTQRRLVQGLMKEHGMGRREAEAALRSFMESQAPGRASQALGRASRDVRFAKGQAARVPRFLSRILLRR